MTTDTEIKEALDYKRSWKPGMPEPKSYEWIFDVHLETVERRSKLAEAFIPLGRHRVDFCTVKRRRWSEGGYSVDDMLKRFTKIKEALTGEEVFDRTAFLSVYGDLRMMKDEYDSFRASLKSSDNRP